jgi:DNA-binding response OmpR family regulator
VPTVSRVAVSGILVVEDDERIGATLVRALDGSGFSARWERSGEAAVQAAETRAPALVLLDLGLPDVDGLEVCGRLRRRDPTLPIVMLTARHEELDVVIGLNAGAVDYVIKPFKLAELLARIRAQLRQWDQAPADVLAVGDLRLDSGAHRALVAGVEIFLRPKEFDLLARLMAAAGQVVTRETLMADVWDENWFGPTKTLDVHVAALRHKVDAPGRPSRITTVRGVGFRVEVP